MNIEEIKELLEKLKQCDDFHNRCDFLMEHNEITYMLDYITKLQQENQKLKDNWNKIEQIIENERMSHWAPSPLFLTELLSKMQELEKGGINE